MLFQLGDLAPGESTTITTGHIMLPTQVATALNTLGAMTIVQPTDIMTGPSVAFTAGMMRALIGSIPTYFVQFPTNDVVLLSP